MKQISPVFEILPSFRNVTMFVTPSLESRHNFAAYGTSSESNNSFLVKLKVQSTVSAKSMIFDVLFGEDEHRQERNSYSKLHAIVCNHSDVHFAQNWLLNEFVCPIHELFRAFGRNFQTQATVLGYVVLQKNKPRCSFRFLFQV